VTKASVRCSLPQGGRGKRKENVECSASLVGNKSRQARLETTVTDEHINRESMNQRSESWTRRQLTIAALRAMEMFSDGRYAGFLQESEAGSVEKDWFDWFLGAWSIARTLSKQTQKRRAVRKYINSRFRAAILRARTGTPVDNASMFSSEKCWGAKKLQNGRTSSTVSLFSKVAFFFRPDVFIPYDTTALEGLTKLVETKRKGVRHALNARVYGEYLSLFDQEYRRARRELTTFLSKPWVKDVAKRLGLPQQFLLLPRFQRKVFDNLLMQLGGRQLTPEG